MKMNMMMKNYPVENVKCIKTGGEEDERRRRKKWRGFCMLIYASSFNIKRATFFSHLF